MAESGAQKNKLKLLRLLEILRRETDEEHPLAAMELVERLAAYGIHCERKAIYRDIASLNEFGYEVLSTRSPKQGFFLAGRELELPEVRLLLDAVASAPFITEKKTTELAEKLCRCLSENHESMVRAQIGAVDHCDRVKFDNEEVYYNIDTIHRAIQQNKKVSFHYFRKTLISGKVRSTPSRSFRISPYALVWKDDNYYVVGNYEKYDNLSSYRIDRMKQVALEEETARPCSEVSEYENGFDTAAFLQPTFSMFGSSSEETVTLSCDIMLLEAMLDRFGELEILEQDEMRFTFRTKVRVGDGFYSWALRWGGRVLVLEPEAVKEQVIDRIRDLADAYCEL